MSKQTGNGRAALLGVLFAMVGFSYAIATTSGVDAGPGVSARAFSTNPLHFTNPVVSGERDLGDIVAGSAFVRWARAAGGVPPYKFVSTNGKNNSLIPIGSVLPKAGNITPAVLLKGEIIGSTAVNFSPVGGLVKFNIEVTDSSSSNAGAGNTVVDLFRLTVVTGTQFRFAIDSVPDAVQYRPYQTNVPVINGKGPFKYTVSNIKVNGVAKTSFSNDVGLNISSTDGTIFGKPIVSGTVTFTVNATDAANASALSRDGSATGQNITLDIASNTIVSSDVMATQISIKLDTATAGKDSISYSGVASLNGQAVSSLAGSNVTLRIGGYVTPDTTATPSTLDDKGKIVKPSVKDKTAVTLKGSVSSKAVKIQVGKEGFGKANLLGTITGNGVPLAVSVQVGSVIVGTEILNFSVKTKGTSVQLTYKLGSNLATAGNFLVTTVSGKDDTKTTQSFDSWKVGFLAQAPATTAGNSGNLTAGSIAQAKSAEVEIGQTFADKINLGDVKNEKVSSNEKRDSKSASVTKITVDAGKAKSSLQTGFLPGSATGISSASKAGDGSKANFALNVSLFSNTNGGGNKVFAGEGAQTIFAKKTSWSEKNPVK